MTEAVSNAAQRLEQALSTAKRAPIQTRIPFASLAFIPACRPFLPHRFSDLFSFSQSPRGQAMRHERKFDYARTPELAVGIQENDEGPMTKEGQSSKPETTQSKESPATGGNATPARKSAGTDKDRRNSTDCRKQISVL
ncbi:MAG TPA: hypothetical protein VNN22_09700 [Verrucomicrobiae bacterium]|nr:hypothetical protein [Verrucomicrobiae bacterium]